MTTATVRSPSSHTPLMPMPLHTTTVTQFSANNNNGGGGIAVTDLAVTSPANANANPNATALPVSLSSCPVAPGVNGTLNGTAFAPRADATGAGHTGAGTGTGTGVGWDKPPPRVPTVGWRNAPGAEGLDILEVARHSKAHSAKLALKWDVFLREWMIHLFLPFSAPFVYLFEGVWSSRNRHFSGCNRVGSTEFIIQMLQYVVQCAFWVMVGLALAYPRKVYDSGVIVDVVAVLILTNYRNLLIGLKYAYLSRRVLTDHRQVLRPNADMRADELLFGWLPLRTDVARRKVDAACGRCGLDSGMPLVLEMDDEREDPLRECQVLFRDALQVCPELSAHVVRVPNTATCVRVPAKLVVMQAVLSQSTDFHTRPWATELFHSAVNNIGAAILAFLPLVIRSFSWGRGNGAQAEVEWDMSLTITVVAAAIYQFPIASQFVAPALYTAFLDFYRRFVWLQFAGDMVAEGCVREVAHSYLPHGGSTHSPRHGHSSAATPAVGHSNSPTTRTGPATSSSSSAPLAVGIPIKATWGFRVHLDVAENAYGWVRTRQWLYDVGWEFHLRTRVYFVALLLVMLAIATALVVQTFTQLDSNSVANSPAYYALVIYTDVVLAALFAAILYYGIWANSLAEKHVTLVANVKHEVQRHRLAVLQRQAQELIAQSQHQQQQQQLLMQQLQHLQHEKLPYAQTTQPPHQPLAHSQSVLGLTTHNHPPTTTTATTATAADEKAPLRMGSYTAVAPTHPHPLPGTVTAANADKIARNAAMSTHLFDFGAGTTATTAPGAVVGGVATGPLVLGPGSKSLALPPPTGAAASRYSAGPSPTAGAGPAAPVCTCAWLPTALCTVHTPFASAGAHANAATRGPGSAAAPGGAPSIEYHEHLVELLQSTIDILKAEDQTNAVTLAGIRVSDNFIRAFLTIAASVVGIALRQILLGSAL